MHDKHPDHHNCCDDKEDNCCEKVPPPLRLYASVGVTSECCIASGKRETDLGVDLTGASAEIKGTAVGLGGLGIATGQIKADAGKNRSTYRVLYMEDNVVQTTTFKMCWETCGGYPGKHVELEIAETFPRANDVALTKELTAYTCLPPSSSCCDCCCLTFVIKTCHTCDELRDPNRVHRQLQFRFKAIDGCGNSKECVINGLEP